MLLKMGTASHMVVRILYGLVSGLKKFLYRLVSGLNHADRQRVKSMLSVITEPFKRPATDIPYMSL